MPTSTIEFSKRAAIFIGLVLVPVLVWKLFHFILIAIVAVLLAALLHFISEPFRWLVLPKGVALMFQDFLDC